MINGITGEASKSQISTLGHGWAMLSVAIAYLLLQLPGIDQPVEEEVQAAGHDLTQLGLWEIRAIQVLHEAIALLLGPAV